MSTIRTLASAAACAVILASAPYVMAASGDLDGSFGTCGVVITNIGGGGELKGLALQPDGKIVAAGSHLVAGSGHGFPSTPDIVVLRYNDDGTLDGSFGSGGIVTTGRSTDSFENGRSVVLQPDGKIVVGGTTTLVRYDGNGMLDGTFGTGGIVANVSANALILQPDGKLVTAGQTSGSDSDFQVARYNDDGSLDGTFGTGGIVTTPIGSDFDQAYALVLQPDDKLVAAGSITSGNRDFALVRYAADGSLDGTFGSAGIVVDNVTPGNDSLAALILQPDGKLVGAGTIYDFVVARFGTDGTRDSGFGTGGLATTSFGTYSEANALALQSTKLIAAGSNGNQVTLVAHNTDGTLDTAFGTGGIVTTQVSTGAYTNALVIQSDGKLIVGGTTYPGNVFLARYFGTEGATGDPPSPCPTATGPSPTPTPMPTVTPTVVPVCAAVPATDCRKPTRPETSKIQLKNGAPDTNDSLLWKWNSGAATTKAEFGDPMAATNYALCIYDRSGGAPARIFSASIPSNYSGPCDGKPCWKELTRGYKYSDKLATPSGIRTVRLREGADGYAKIAVKGKGVDLDMPQLALAQDPMVTVQLVKDGGLCWDADYSVPATKNVSSDFKDSSD